MQNRYFGDLGDFLKYRLLRSVCGIKPAGDRLSLGVVWYLNKEESDDGKFVRYLDKPGGDHCKTDAELFGGLRAFRERWGPYEPGRNQPPEYEERRNVGLLATSGLFPGASWFSDLVPHKESERGDWLKKALDQVRDQHVVFLDPDNGLQVKSTPKWGKRRAKYVLMDELKEFCSRDHHVVAYQHRQRRGLQKQIEERTKQMRCCVADAHVFAVVPPEASRLFYVICREDRAGFPKRVRGLPRDVMGKDSRHLSVGCSELKPLTQDTGLATSHLPANRAPGSGEKPEEHAAAS